MNITSARYADEQHTSLIVEIDGAVLNVPVDSGNRHYQAVLASGIEIAPANAPSP